MVANNILVKGAKRDRGRWIYPIYSKGKDWCHMRRCGGTKVCRDEILIKMFRNIFAEICIKCIAGFKNKRNWKKIGIKYMIK
jgi:hypothetical protein